MTQRREKLLLVEDDPDDRVIVGDLLSKIGRDRFDLTWASTYDDGIAEVGRQSFDLLLIDYRLGARTGVEMLNALSETTVAPPPAIMLTGQDAREVDLAAMYAGAADYLVKWEFGPRELERAMRYAIEHARAVAALSESEQRYRLMFDRSPLPMWILQPETGRFLAVNEAAVQLYGYSRQEFLAMTSRDIHPAEDRAIPAEEAGEFSGRPRAAGVWRHRKKSGETLLVKITRSDIELSGVPARLVLVDDITFEVQARQTLQESEHNLRRLFDALPVSIMLVDGDCRLVDANPAARRLWALPEQGSVNSRDLKVFGAGTDQLIPAEERGLTLAARDQRPASERLFEIESLDGRRRTVIASALPFSERAGRGVRAIGVQLDITEVRQARAEAARGREQFRQVLDHSEDAILIVDDKGFTLYANPAALAVLGNANEDLSGLWFGVPVVGASEPSEIELHVPGGGRRLMELRATSTEWEGHPVRLLTLRDRTERELSAEMLRLRERAIASAMHGIVIADALDAELPLIYVNPAFERITGYSAAEALGRNCRFLQGEDRVQEDLAELRRSIAERREGSVVLRNYRKDGTPFWNELHVSPVRDASGQVTHYVGIQNDVTERKRQEEEIVYLGSHDTLTGLPNRGLMVDRVGQALRFAQRGERGVVVAHVDIDGFKYLNESLGHDSGDSLIRQVAARLTESVRDGDTVARAGGDEFVVIAANVASRDDLPTILGKLQSVFAEPFELNSKDLVATACIGISFYPDDGGDVAGLLRRADLALNHAKTLGRSSAVEFSAELETQVSDRVVIEARLREALRRGEFVLHYQPQVNLGSRRVTGVEALVRWNHPELGLLPPGRFISIAENSGLIVPLGEWVLRAACIQARAWQDAQLGDFTVAVNISAAQFRRKDFLTTVGGILKETGLDPSLLELEITESLAMEFVEQFISTLRALRKLGVRISIDDFGTGYSSLSYLKRFPIEKLKIDRSFVREITTRPEDAAIARAIISMAHHLHLSVIAEGVETQEQASFLQRNACDEAQGFLFSQGLPAAEIPAFLAQAESAAGQGEVAAGEPGAVLLLDDEENILRALIRVLRRDGYTLFSAPTADRAFELLALHDIGVVVADHRMPGMSGVDFLSKVRDLYPETVRIILSGYADIASITEAINQGGVHKFLTKPWDDAEMRAEVAEARRRYLGKRQPALPAGLSEGLNQ
jgi:diguanylate cyclase (GGDEF)-like protein/PAS domain S-box-containing protein